MVPRAAPSRGHAGATSRAARSRGGGACRAATGRRVGQRMAKRRDVSADGVVGAMRSAAESAAAFGMDQARGLELATRVRRAAEVGASPCAGVEARR